VLWSELGTLHEEEPDENNNRKMPARDNSNNTESLLNENDMNRKSQWSNSCMATLIMHFPFFPHFRSVESNTPRRMQ